MPIVAWFGAGILALAAIVLLGSTQTAVNLMGKLTAQQVAGYAKNAGFDGDDLVTAVAIAFAESAGDPNAPGDFVNGVATSIGLWQIHWTVHPEFDKTKLTDPQYNANAAYQLYSRRGGDFTDWATYTVPRNGQLPYLAFLDEAQKAVTA